VSRNDNPAWSAWVFEHIVVATMTFGPSIPFESRHNFRPVGFGLSHARSGVNIGAFYFVNQPMPNTGVQINSAEE
jgi:hypothetical protein